MANIGYKAIVSATNKLDKKYFDIGETAFKEHFTNHTKDFRNKRHVNRAELSEYLRKLKDKTPKI